MAVELTPSEQALVANSRLSPRPRFFNAQALQQTEISADFEAFLILQDPDTVSSTLTWLAQTGSLMEANLKRGAIAFEALVADSEDRAARQSEVSDLTDSFNEWRSAFQAGKFSDVPEVGLIIADMQATAEEVFVLEERMKHLEQVQSRVSDRLRQGVSSAQLQELLSWPVPLLAY